MIPIKVNDEAYPVGWGAAEYFCRGVRRSHKWPGYDSKQSDGEAPIIIGFGVMQSTTSLQSLPIPLWPEMVESYLWVK